MACDRCGGCGYRARVQQRPHGSDERVNTEPSYRHFCDKGTHVHLRAKHTWSPLSHGHRQDATRTQNRVLESETCGNRENLRQPNQQVMVGERGCETPTPSPGLWNDKHQVLYLVSLRECRADMRTDSEAVPQETKTQTCVRTRLAADSWIPPIGPVSRCCPDFDIRGNGAARMAESGRENTDNGVGVGDDLDQAVRMGKRKRTLQNRTHDAENRSIRAYAQSQRKHRYDRKTRTLAKQPQAVPHALK